MKKKDLNIAVLGATGNVGRQMLTILSEHGYASSQVTALASARSENKSVSFGEDDVLKVMDAHSFDFNDVDVVLSSIGSKAILPLAEKITARSYLIDNSSAFRMEEDVPLVIPEINAEAIKKTELSGIVANPNCVMIQMALALYPLHKLSPIKRIVASTYQSVSGAGKRAMDELFSQTRAVFMNTAKTPEELPRSIAFNLIPQIDEFDENGDTGEETKITQEFQKVMDKLIPLTVTCVRVPVFIGHSVAINVTFEEKIPLEIAKKALLSTPGIRLAKDHDSYITPIDCAGEDFVYVSRLRVDHSHENTLNMWVVGDNVRKGAALNAVQIMECMLKEGILGRICSSP